MQPGAILTVAMNTGTYGRWKSIGRRAAVSLGRGNVGR